MDSVSQETVAVLGASDKSDRYSNRAIRALHEAGHIVIPVNPALSEVNGIQVVAFLDEVPAGTVDTVTVYLSAARSEPLAQQLVALDPKRVILNPGAESTFLTDTLEENSIEVVNACTLVMLASETFS